MGRRIAETLIDVFGDLAPNNPLLERMDLMAPEEIETYRSILRRIAGAAPEAIDAADRRSIMRLAFGYIEPRHRLGLLDEDLQAAIVAARKAFRDNLPGGAVGRRALPSAPMPSTPPQASRTTSSSGASSTLMPTPRIG